MAPKKTPPPLFLTLADDIIAYEEGTLNEEQVIALFQRLIDNGMAWTLQGHYGRTAEALINQGFCTKPE